MSFNRNTIRCEHPTILLDPRFDKLALKYGTVVLRGHRYPLLTRVCYDVAKFRSQFYPRKCDITYDDIDSCYFLNQRTGEKRPLYMVVPCGKCALCRNRKSSAFAARCVAELAESKGTPLFVTFTYSPEYYPASGLNRLDMQMFFKRLRQRLDYYGFANAENPLRYTYVGEYGSHTKRAHYHAIIFNFPSEVGNIAQIQKFIQRCWSRFIIDPETGKRVPLVGSDGNQLRFPSGAKAYKTEPIGWTKTLPVTRGCVGYVAKYIRKVQQIPVGCNDTFHCSSNRYGGIGAAYIRKFRQSFMENPDMVSIPVLDRISGKTFYIPIDGYVKNLFIPTSSRLFSRADYDVIKEFINDLRLFQLCAVHYRKFTPLDRYNYAQEVQEHWKEPFLEWQSREHWKKAYARVSRLDSSPLFRKSLDEMSFLVTKEQTEECLAVLIDDLNNLTEKILIMPDYRKYLCDRDRFVERRSSLLEALFADNEYNIPRMVEVVTKRLADSLHRETF